MSFVPEYRICPKCKRKYSWDPDVGHLTCPYCSGEKKAHTDLLNIVKYFFKKRENKTG